MPRFVVRRPFSSHISQISDFCSLDSSIIPGLKEVYILEWFKIEFLKSLLPIA